MAGIINGLNEFQNTYFSTHQELFEQLSHGQTPEVLFITCSDSRIDPFLITQAQPGDLFIIRNVGNVIPTYGATSYAEGAAIEYAVHALGIKDVIICGHSHCGAMKGLLQVGSLAKDMPLVYDWLKHHAEATRRLVVDHYTDKGYSLEELLKIAIKQNVLTQIENLKTYPIIRSKMHEGTINLHAWIYSIELGTIFAYRSGAGLFVPLEQRSFPVPDPLLEKDSRGRWLWLQAIMGEMSNESSVVKERQTL
ncbi:carbonic anhydrase [Stenomitos frigidus]|nr:carbonic anhydrase [Stenomitos frigidus]